MKYKALIISDRNYKNAPRIINEVELLKKEYDIYLLTTNNPEEEGVKWISSKNYSQKSFFEKLLDKIYFFVFRSRYPFVYPFRCLKYWKLINRDKFRVVILHDPDKMPDISCASKGEKILKVFNAHEYHPLEFENDWNWLRIMGKYYFQVYQKYLHKFDILINVSDGIRKECLKLFGVDSIVIPNAHPYIPLTPKFSIDNFRPIKIIHFGSFNPNRKIENMICMAEQLGKNYHLTLVTLEDDINFENIRSKAENLINVTVLNDIPLERIVPEMNNHDIGLCFLPDHSFNYRHSLPNKLFQYIQARVAIIGSPIPEIAGMIRKYNLGVIPDDNSVTAFVKAITNLDTQQINKIKIVTNEIAKKITSESCYQVLGKSIEKRIR